MIMKKVYISPQTVSHVVTPVMPLAASKFDSTATGPQSVTPSNETVSEFTSRRGSVWGDDDNDF
jgi:hypothetical protein